MLLLPISMLPIFRSSFDQRKGSRSRDHSPQRRRGWLRCTGNHGYSLVELVVTLGILSLTAAYAISYIDPDQLDLERAKDAIAGQLRITRGNAMTRGAHYSVTFNSSTTYIVARLQDPDDDGVWTWEETIGSYEVPYGITVTPSDDGVFEFNGRGLLAPAPGATAASTEDLTIVESDTGDTIVLQVWPSGQIREQ